MRRLINSKRKSTEKIITQSTVSDSPLTGTRVTRSMDLKITEPEEIQQPKVPKVPHLSEKDRIRIQTLYHDAKWSINKIALEIPCARPTVEKWIKRDDAVDLPHTGRPQVYDRGIVENLQRHHQEWSGLDIHRNWNREQEGKDPVLSTVYAIRKELPFKVVSAQPHHLFKPHQLLDRVEAAKLHEGPRKKHSAFFDDETSIGKQAHVHRLHVFDGDDPNYQLLQSIKGFSGHFFAAISYRGKTPLVAFDKKLDSRAYQLLLDNYVVPLGEELYGRRLGRGKRNWSLCQDGDGAHSSNDTLEYLQSKGISLYWLPPWSPDMNPMEFMWYLLWVRVAKMKPSTNEEVVRFAKQCWDEIPQSIVCGVIDHLDVIYKYIIEHNGELYKHRK